MKKFIACSHCNGTAMSLADPIPTICQPCKGTGGFVVNAPERPSIKDTTPYDEDKRLL